MRINSISHGPSVGRPVGRSVGRYNKNNMNRYPDGVSGDVSDWTGYDCSQRTCPTGDTPHNQLTSKAEIQTFLCETDDDSTAEFTLTFRDETTEVIRGEATAAEVEAALEALPTIGSVSVAFADSAQKACGDLTQNVTVTFLSELGPLPEMGATAITNIDSITVTVTRTTTTLNVECANKGLCDRDTGLCECFPACVREYIQAG